MHTARVSDKSRIAPWWTRSASPKTTVAVAAVLVSFLGAIIPAIASETVYRVDLSRYFSTADVERTDRGRIIASVAAFEARRLRVSDPTDLEAYLHQAERIRVELMRHEAYLHLKSSIDTADHEASSGTDELETRLEQLTAIVDAALQRLTPREFTQAVAKRPSLGKYAFLVDEARRRAAHTLPPAQELILDQLSKPTLSALFDLYTQTVATTPFATIVTPEGKRDVRADLMTNRDPSIRRRATEELLDGYASRAPLYAGILLAIARERDRVARLKHFDDAPSAVYFGMFKTTASIKACLADIEHHADVYRDYQTLRARHVGAELALGAVHSWDMAAPLQGFEIPQFTMDGVRNAALEALEPFGPEYTADFHSLLDPAARRADIAPGAPNRYNAGYSEEPPGVVSALYIGNFRGGLNDARVIVHEGGHAVHGQLRSQNAASPFYAEGPNWMGEGIAILNELLLYDHLYTASRDPGSRAYY